MKATQQIPTISFIQK